MKQCAAWLWCKQLRSYFDFSAWLSNRKKYLIMKMRGISTHILLCSLFINILKFDNKFEKHNVELIFISFASFLFFFFYFFFAFCKSTNTCIIFRKNWIRYSNKYNDITNKSSMRMIDENCKKKRKCWKLNKFKHVVLLILNFLFNFKFSKMFFFWKNINEHFCQIIKKWRLYSNRIS